MRKGFTLVELSIVLIIIGLLIGGILAAQSMISTAKVTSQIEQIQQFDAGVASYVARMGYIPGDAPATGGNGDGVISNTTVVNTFCNEHPNFWNQMAPDKYAMGTLAGGSCYYVRDGTMPLSTIGSKGSFFYVTADSTDGGNTLYTPAVNYYVLLGGTQLRTTWRYINSNPVNGTYTQSAATSQELYALDTKMDNGIANSGNVKSGTILMWIDPSMGGASSSSALATCSSGANYDLTQTGYNCTPMIKVGGQTGM